MGGQYFVRPDTVDPRILKSLLNKDLNYEKLAILGNGYQMVIIFTSFQLFLYLRTYVYP